MNTLQQIAQQDGRYDAQALQFILDALQYAEQATGRRNKEGAERHVSGQELLEGVRIYGLQVFGPLTARVFRRWGVHETIDWGNIVFLLIEHERMSRQDEDTLDQFRDGYDFDSAFVDDYRIELTPEVVARIASGAE